MDGYLTKANFMSGLQCQKQLWLTVKEPHRATAPTPAQQRLLEQGNEVGRYARQQFPQGHLIEGNGFEAVQSTQAAIAAGASCLFEATFCFDHVFVRCDILRQTATATWEVLEVKASSQVKAEHYWDVAVQAYVLAGVGLLVGAAKLMHINTQTCRFPNLANLFTIVDITAAVDRLLPAIPDKLRELRSALIEPEPTLAIGKHCSNPNPCAFTKDCWQHVPELSIFTIPRLDWNQKEALIAQGLLALADLPPDMPLTANQRTYVESSRSQQPVIAQAAIAASLAALAYPIHFFDFESQSQAIPTFGGLKPYEQLPFQYSCHSLHEDGRVEHRAYLHMDSSDPRPTLIDALLADIAPTGSIVVYHQSFEASLLRQLAQTFPTHAIHLEAIVARLWDLEVIFKQHYKHPAFRGSTSIKRVLPVLVPSLSYNALTVQRGDQAQTIWEQLLCCTDGATKTQLMEDLKAYCHLDTLAMVELYKALCELV